MIRLANIQDADQLYYLNEDFNGKGVVTLDILKDRLANNTSEIIIVSEESGTIVGFVCVQVMKSFCYRQVYAEITEVFVSKPYRRKGYASNMIEFAHNYCKENYSVEKFQLFTGRANKNAQKLYKSLGYRKDSAILFRK